MLEKNKNNNAKSAIMVCLIGAVVLMGVLAGITMVVRGSAGSARGLTARDPIYIYGNSDFTAANGVSAGDGSVSNPYIIENWDISATFGHGIYIEGTTVYFVIRNCYIHDGGGDYHGIYFNSVIYGTIYNVTSCNNNYGLYLRSSSNNNITNCAVYNRMLWHLSVLFLKQQHHNKLRRL